MNRFRSCALWEPCHGFDNNITHDLHDTREQAQAVCEMLERDGLSGEKIHFPVSTWVQEEITPKEVK